MSSKQIKHGSLIYLALFVFSFSAVSNIYEETGFTNISSMAGESVAMYDPLSFEQLQNGLPGVAIKCLDWDSSLFHWLNLYESNGDGTFTTLQQYVEMPEETIYFNITGDIDGDGYSDLFTSADAPWTNTIRLSISEGGLSDPYSFTSPNPTTIYGIAQMDDDLRPDLLGASMGHAVVCYLTESEEYEVLDVSSDLSAHCVAAGDLDLDGAQDIVFFGIDNKIHILHNDGNRSFSTFASYNLIPGSYFDLQLSDINGDGYLDIVILSIANMAIANMGEGEVQIYLNDGLSNFTYNDSYQFDQFSYFKVKDLDMDGFAELAVMYDGCISIYKGDEEGSFDLEAPLFYLSDVEPRSFDFEDYDCDGDPDMVCVVSIDNNYYLRSYWNTISSQGCEGINPQVGNLSLGACSNPFTRSVTITASGTQAPSELTIFDSGGRTIACIIAEAEGTYHWNGMLDGGEEASAGIYFACAQSNGKMATTALVKID